MATKQSLHRPLIKLWLFAMLWTTYKISSTVIIDPRKHLCFKKICWKLLEEFLKRWDCGLKLNLKKGCFYCYSCSQKASSVPDLPSGLSCKCWAWSVGLWGVWMESSEGCQSFAWRCALLRVYISVKRYEEALGSSLSSAPLLCSRTLYSVHLPPPSPPRCSTAFMQRDPVGWEYITVGITVTCRFPQ